MASLKPRITPGSAPWIVTEARNADEAIEQEVEDFGYSVRNELEWLNEHMAEIFSANQINVNEIFKTPGKLRGKTPRTARKRNALGERAPLTDIFAPNAQPTATASPAKNSFYDQINRIRTLQDQENAAPTAAASTKSATAPTARLPKQATDSGYHGITDDEMEVDQFPLPPASLNAVDSTVQHAVGSGVALQQSEIEDRRATEETYVSAKSSLGSRKPSHEGLKQLDQDDIADKDDDGLMLDPQPSYLTSNTTAPAISVADAPEVSLQATSIAQTQSSHGLVRKSSLTFSALPGREPLTGKKSIGPQQGQRTSIIDQYRSTIGRGSYLGRYTGGKSLGGHPNGAETDHETDDDRMEEDENERPVLQREESETTKIHNKTSTQRLHEKISMLGQTREIRPSKSIPLNNAAANPVAQQIAALQAERKSVEDLAQYITAAVTQSTQPTLDDDEDDWIAPIKATSTAAKGTADEPSQQMVEKPQPEIHRVPVPSQSQTQQSTSPLRKALFGHKKNASSSNLESPTKAAMAPDPSLRKPIAVSNPNPANPVPVSFTPTGSPSRKVIGDGPLSASKAKLYSVLRSAKGIFASSAGVSAQAKMEALSPAPLPKPQHYDDLPSPQPEIGPMPALYPNLSAAAHVPEPEGRRTRSSTEKEQKKRIDEERERHKAADELAKARDKERQKATNHANKSASRPASPVKSIRSEAGASKEMLQDTTDDMPPPPPPKSLLPQTSTQRLREVRRIAKPVQPSQQLKVKPAPVHVRMPSQRIGHLPVPSSSASYSQVEQVPPPPPPKNAEITSKPSNPTLHQAASVSSLKSVSSFSGAKKALEAAAKKKEQDAKAAQRKAEQKRELELRKQAKLEEDRRVEQQRKAAEQAKIVEAKKLAQRQAAEAKRLEQQRRDAQRPPSRERQQPDLATVLQQDRAQQQPQQSRPDLASARPIARMPLVAESSRPMVQINPAKPPKRALQADAEDDQQQQLQRPAVGRNPPSYQQLDNKRRKTNEEVEEPVEQQRRSVMAPPVRQSNIRKETNKYAYSNMPSSSTQHQQSMFIKTVTSQHQLAHPRAPTQDMAKFANARIPFAEAPNPPAGPSSQQQPHFKTPGRPMPNASAQLSSKHAKSSPHYPAPDSIKLPEIMTDSEDEDSENEFAAPDWVNSPALRALLQQQQLVDPEHIFGPIAPLQMEEVFKHDLKRAKKFRDRTSSALWTSDRLTEEERRKDREARERLIREGGWTFAPDT